VGTLSPNDLAQFVRALDLYCDGSVLAEQPEAAQLLWEMRHPHSSSA
jgi:hypothetical protein